MSQGVHDQIEAVTGILEFDQPVTAFSLMRRRNAEPLDIARNLRPRISVYRSCNILSKSASQMLLSTALKFSLDNTKQIPNNTGVFCGGQTQASVREATLLVQLTCRVGGPMRLLDPQKLDRFFSESAVAPRDVLNGSLLERSLALLPDERLIMELAFKSYLTHRQIAQLLNVPAGTVTRRLQRICRRLRDPLVVLLLDERCPLPSDTRAIAIGHFLHNRSATQLSRQLGIRRQEILRTLNYVRGWHRGVRDVRP
jgi:DNA-directed RNA polymerase specialized sigma24 family protein